MSASVRTRPLCSRLIIGTAAALLAAGCADQTTAPRPSPASAPLSASAYKLSSGGLEFRHLFTPRELNGAKNGAWSLATATNVSFHGGRVLTGGTNVVAVYWGAPGYANLPAAGSGAGNNDGTLIGGFLRSLGGSAYFHINSTYYDKAGTYVPNTVNYAAYWVNPSAPPASPSDADMVAMLQSGFTSGAITYDPNTLYAILTGSGVNLGGGFGTQYCAYHTHGTVTPPGYATAQTVLYAAMPYNQQYLSACTSGYKPANGSVDPAADYEVNTLAHEIEETTTDAMGNAWYDFFGYENGDKCAWTWGPTSTDASTGGVYNETMTDPVSGTTHHFLIQENWVRISPAHCAQGY